MFRTRTRTASSDSTPRGARRLRRTVATVAVTAAFVAPVAAYAATGFVDVPESNVFHDDIDWLADAGVTLGCNPPANDEFCPGDAVTREQMAAFMHRLADNQVVDAGAIGGVAADRVVTSDSGDLAYAWACEPALASYDPFAECDFAHNSGGDGIQIERTAVGQYRVTMENLGGPVDVYGGNVQVTAYGAAPTTCNVKSWNSTGDVTITVLCWDAAGAATDSEFDVQYVK